MIQAIADNIYSPLGTTTADNMNAVLAGESHLRLHTEVHGRTLHEPVMASLLEQLPEKEGLSAFEALCVASVEKAVQGLEEEVRRDDCIFVVSTTKGNIWSSPALSAEKIARFFGNSVQPVVVSTACTSGVTAQIVAQRLLEQGGFRTAVVVGVDVQSEFIISGFQSFKALSTEECRPFDASRNGLNAGEAAATLVLQRTESLHGRRSWVMLGGSVHNDANHISGPSRTAEGSLRCLEDVLRHVQQDDLAFVSVHGTGTLYNDEMESIALHRAGLDSVPVSALKGCYGHTMGAAGLLETILSMHAAEKGIVLPSRGYKEQGTTCPVNISGEPRQTEQRSFVKLLSGFGGVNAAVAWTFADKEREETVLAPVEPHVVATLSLSEADDLVALYRKNIGDWPKFFKMDLLSRLGFVGTELLLKKAGVTPDQENTPLVFANRTASLKNDTDYEATIADSDNYYPSPALFVYTLPNIVCGEVAIRRHLFSETVFYVLPDESRLFSLAAHTMTATGAKHVVAAWLEAPDKEHFSAHLVLYGRD